MTKPNKRRVRMDQFKAQITEQVLPEDRLVPVELGQDKVVTIKLPILLDEDDPYVEEMQAAITAEEIALVVFSGSDVPAEDQWQVWQLAGYDGTDLMELFTAERAAAEDRFKAFRYKG